MKPTKSEPTKIELNATLRTELGKKVKQLRKKGIIPGNVYGSDFKPAAISINLKEFNPVYKASGETGIIYLQLDGKAVPTLVREMMYHPVSNDILHIDFRQINLKEKIETHVPIQLEGESSAVKLLGGVLLTQTSELLIEALPANIPAHIIIDISKITEIGQETKVSDLPTSPDYIILDDPEKILISVVEHKEESLEAQTDRDETEITTEKADEEGAEAEAGTDKGDTPTEAPTDDKKE